MITKIDALGRKEELNFILPVGNGNRHNGSFRIERHPDGSVSVSCRQDIHTWGTTETIRLSSEAWEIVQAFVAGDEGGYYKVPFMESYFAEQYKAQEA